MFTGIITDIGRIASVENRGDMRVTVEAGYDHATIDMGASISCSGVCLTVVDKGPGWFAVDVSGETISRTASQWSAGSRLNLERAMKIGDEIGGHIVTGHVDGTGTVRAIQPDGDSRRIGFSVGPALAPYLAAKGSVTIDGVSLTVNEVSDQPDGTTHFAVNIIPHTAQVTTLGALAEGDIVNIEIDVLARYLARMEEVRRHER
ncbi:riboflavin synthase [Sphingomonas sp. ID0503]|uniref:riboflavin synthase n=1 Tax=Sphingomonas sp. ID0503 TaxID=3399691 RepID=UPI003AFB7CE7